jgi:hypothetical protein
MDPSYDTAPEYNYQCSICHQRGIHYRSVCPYNEDPFSINQQRLRQGATTGLGAVDKKLRREVSPIHGRNRSPKSPSVIFSEKSPFDKHIPYRQANSSSSDGSKVSYSPTLAPSPQTRITKAVGELQELDNIDELKSQLERSDSVDSVDIRNIRVRGMSSNGSEEENSDNFRELEPIVMEWTPARRVSDQLSPSPTKTQTLQRKLLRIEVYEERVVRDVHPT